MLSRTSNSSPATRHDTSFLPSALMPRIAMPRIPILLLPITLVVIISLIVLAQQHPHTAEYLDIKSWSSWTEKFYRNRHEGASRLNLTLAGNELRYQMAVAQRKEIMAQLPPDTPAFADPFASKYTLWDLVIPAFSCPFPVYRVGNMADGGKYVCGLERATHQDRCIIYSMGVERQSSFEQEILHQSDKCEVHGFDFSVTKWGPELLNDHEVNNRSHFHQYKITGKDNHNASPKEYSLSGIMKELGHDFIDILKVDIEGSEWRTLYELIASFDGKPLPFGQMQIEIHVGWTPEMKTMKAVEGWWTMLEEAGLRAFWTEVNLGDVNSVRRGPIVAEWSFINIRGNHALLNDRLPDYP
ncbi:Methyltranfer-dom domain-containing protein [Mycena indigotica]|uniref:Methyltranfer-dom domain-containing protein n=1 Tax=Mycena indigotica TaxID=2126181 RepID=A0A8H6W6G2_9AGAR|nr:Methyltranfer-dom domain-containing protein [Mycena indigotica]KAF7307589.1 Methyltranfer-dom domain-containing protein [Mycena indigotica]